LGFGLAVVSPKIIENQEFIEEIGNMDLDLLVCVHGRKIIKKNVLEVPRLGAINVHPCLYKYPGAKPVERMLEDGITKASVGVHRMSEIVDEGEVLEEIFVDVSECKNVVEVYNKLYPHYSIALNRVLEIIGTKTP
jgi:methionyl-tRNA formyltransferase